MRAGFAANLARYRQAKGVSQREAAQHLGVSQALLSHYEKGIREPGLEFVVRAAEYYKVSTDQLLNYDGRSNEANICAPKGALHEMEQGIRDGLDFSFSLLFRYYDPVVCYYAIHYMGATLYDLLRNLGEEFLDYAPEWYSVSDNRSKYGAVTADMVWLRSRFVTALHQMGEEYRDMPRISEAEIRSYLGPRYDSIIHVLQTIDQREIRQETEERAAYQDFTAWAEERQQKGTQQSVSTTPEEEETI